MLSEVYKKFVEQKWYMFQRAELDPDMWSQSQAMVHSAAGNELEECMALCSHGVDWYLHIVQTRMGEQMRI